MLFYLGHVNVAPRHLTAEAETLLSATLIHEVMHVLGFDPHAFTHFRDERKRRRGQVIKIIFPLIGVMVSCATVDCNASNLI
jgi:leishmanolysin